MLPANETGGQNDGRVAHQESVTSDGVLSAGKIVERETGSESGPTGSYFQHFIQTSWHIYTLLHT